MANILKEKQNTLLASAALIGLLAGLPAYALAPSSPIAQATKAQDTQDENKDAKADEDDKKDKSAKDDEKKKPKTIETVVKDQTKLDGLFVFYQDPKKGNLSLEINANQIGKEFIYASHAADGVTVGGHFRGQYRGQGVYVFRKYFDRLELVQKNTNFYFDPDNAIARAADANISESVVATFKIDATTSGVEGKSPERYLVKADDLFLSEALDQVKPSTRPGPPNTNFTLGKFSKAKSKIAAVKNYPANSSIQVDYVFENPNVINGGNTSVTDARYVTVKLQHTLIEMPNNDYKPRFDDARVGYFTDQVTDLTSRSATPYRDLVHRWNLAKKDPSAALSEPVEPIVWWIENTTPRELRDPIREGVLNWNIAFEAIGFKNAVVVKEQPDDADWDADDIRYNVLRWTSSPQPPFGGYGPSLVNPRTGQILGADIMLEYSYVTNRLNTGKLFSKAALGFDQFDAESLEAQLASPDTFCAIGPLMQQNNLVGQAFALANSPDGTVDPELTKQALYRLALHEVGHTLGLNHNMRATQARSYETAHVIEEQKDGLSGSVMDYPAINFAKLGAKQAYYYDVRPGSYDMWAIEFGYSPEIDDPKKRDALLARSTEKGLAFGNDADDMRAPGKAIDPRVNIFDFSDNAVAYAADRLALGRDAMGKILEKLPKSGESYQELRNAYLLLTGDMATQGNVASRYIGGVMVERAVHGQAGETVPYAPIPLETQKQAMQLLRDYIFAPNAFAIDSQLASHLAIQRRGYNHFSAGEDPRLHARVLTIQARVLEHLLHPTTLERLSNSRLYGNQYSVTTMLQDLTNAIFQADNRGSVNSYRQNLQIHYVKELIKILGADYDSIAQSNALANLRTIRSNMARWRGDAETSAHREHIAFLIDKALEVSKS